MDFVTAGMLGVGAFVAPVILIFSSVFTIHTKQAALFYALRDIGAQSNTILLPHSPAAVSELYAQLRDPITAGNLTAVKSVEKPDIKK